MSSQGPTDGNICNLYTIPFPKITFNFTIYLLLCYSVLVGHVIPLAPLPACLGGSSAKPSNYAKLWSSNQPSNQVVLQICINVVVPVPTAWPGRFIAYHEHLRDLFMTAYKNKQALERTYGVWSTSKARASMP